MLMTWSQMGGRCPAGRHQEQRPFVDFLISFILILICISQNAPSDGPTPSTPPSTDRSGQMRRFVVELSPTACPMLIIVEQDVKLLEAVKSGGKQWATIVRTHLIGRTGLAAKNRLVPRGAAHAHRLTAPPSDTTTSFAHRASAPPAATVASNRPLRTRSAC
jgi:hypothetical protein